MSDYLERLERELLAAGRVYRRRAAAPPAGRRWPIRSRVGRALPIILSLAVTAAVVAIVVAIGATSRPADTTAGHHGHANPTSPIGIIQPRVYTAPACRVRHTLSGLPPLVMSDAPPSPGLGSMLTIARQPASSDYSTQVGAYDRDPVRVLTVFKRFVRVVATERGTRLAFFPAVVCNQTAFGPGQLARSVRITPQQAIVMVVLSNPPPRTAILVGTAAMIRNGQALAGLDLQNNRGWIQAIVVPDGVARVVMQFTPPFLHHYSATATIHQNIGVVVRNPNYTPTTVYWYAANGQLIRTIVNKTELRYDQCLAKHRKDCSGGA